MKDDTSFGLDVTIDNLDERIVAWRKKQLDKLDLNGFACIHCSHKNSVSDTSDNCASCGQEIFVSKKPAVERNFIIIASIFLVILAIGGAYEALKQIQIVEEKWLVVILGFMIFGLPLIFFRLIKSALFETYSKISVDEALYYTAAKYLEKDLIDQAALCFCVIFGTGTIPKYYEYYNFIVNIIKTGMSKSAESSYIGTLRDLFTLNSWIITISPLLPNTPSRGGAVKAILAAAKVVSDNGNLDEVLDVVFQTFADEKENRSAKSIVKDSIKMLAKEFAKPAPNLSARIGAYAQS